MGQITNVHAREILDSRGNPTIEVEVTLATDDIQNFIIQKKRVITYSKK